MTVQTLCSAPLFEFFIKQSCTMFTHKKLLQKNDLVELFSMNWDREVLESSGKVLLNLSQTLTSYVNLFLVLFPQIEKDCITYITRVQAYSNSFSKNVKVCPHFLLNQDCSYIKFLSVLSLRGPFYISQYSHMLHNDISVKNGPHI